jgi:hypothetical protein
MSITPFAFQIRAEKAYNKLANALKNGQTWVDDLQQELCANLTRCKYDTPDDSSSYEIVYWIEERFYQLIIQNIKLKFSSRNMNHGIFIPMFILTQLSGWFCNSCTPRVSECQALINVFEKALASEPGKNTKQISKELKFYKKVLNCHYQTYTNLTTVKQILEKLQNNDSFILNEFYGCDECEIGQQLEFLYRFTASIEYIGHDQGIRLCHPILNTFKVKKNGNFYALTKFI